jgi:hypothetical protein
MAEALEDSQLGAEDIPSEAPDVESMSSELGTDLAEDTQDEATSTEDGHSDGQAVAEFDPNNVDWLRVDADALPDNYKPVANLAKQFQSSYTQAQQQARDEQNRASQERQQYLSALQQLQAQSQPQQQQQTPAEQLGQYLDEDEKRGLEVVQTLFQQQSAPMLEQIESLKSQLAQANQGTQAFTQYLQNQQTQSRLNQVAETRDAYGEEVNNLNDRQMLAMRALVDQGTTVKEAFESVTGKAQQQIEAARAQDREVRSSAKNAVSSNGARAATSGATIETEAELLAAAQALGFE